MSPRLELPTVESLPRAEIWQSFCGDEEDLLFLGVERQHLHDSSERHTIRSRPTTSFYQTDVSVVTESSADSSSWRALPRLLSCRTSARNFVLPLAPRKNGLVKAL